MSEEIEKIIFDLEGCVGMFDYLLKPEDNNLLVSYIRVLQQENQHLLDLQKSMDKQYEELEQENQQLKEELQKADSITQSCILYGDRSSGKTFRESLNLVKQYKSVLDEIREYIEKDYSFAKRHDIPLMSRTEQLAGKLFQILDKVDK